MNPLKGHDHGTFNFTGDFECDACGNQGDEGVFCNACNFTVHKECIFVFSIRETYEHLSHDGHCLKLLTTGAPEHTDPKCHLCGNNTKRILYHCSTCNLSLDIDCMVSDMSARALEMPWHDHNLVKLDLGYQMLCEVCGQPDGDGYFCLTCKLMVHEKCVSVFDSPEITHPFHVKHSLKLLTSGGPSYTDSKCHVCGEQAKNVLYHCDICKFNLDMACAIEDYQQHTVTPVVLSDLKVYEHTVTLVPRLISFICDACGTRGDRSPYVSLQGGDNMFFHQECAHLPRVIHVNRHDHRVSYKYPLGRREWTCEICLEDIDWSCGAYSCSLCPSYALHSRCATRKDVWDGEELDGVPEEVEDSEPFKLNDDNTITHFAHEQHNMSLNKEGKALVESILCEACVHPIASNTFYNCLSCSFILHETCANLPKKKRLFLSPRPLTLRFDNIKEMCNACLQFCSEGFMYTDGVSSFDLVCCSIKVPFIHESHKHPLIYRGKVGEAKDRNNNPKNCKICNSFAQVIGCIKCEYYLDFRCATLPLTVKLQRYDVHPFKLCYGEETRNKYWCNVCERVLNPKTWFYTCHNCCVTLHTFCVLGNMIRYVKPGVKIINNDVELMLNNTSVRPICYTCHLRCVAPFYFRFKNVSFCSCHCLFHTLFGGIGVHKIISRPPWL